MAQNPLSEVKQHYGRLRNYVGGQWVEATGGSHLPVENPATTKVIAEVPLSDPR